MTHIKTRELADREWSKLSKSDRAVVRFGMIPIAVAREFEALGYQPREISLAMFEAAKRAGKPIVL